MRTPIFLLLALTACGSDGVTVPDASPPVTPDVAPPDAVVIDAPPDAPSADAALPDAIPIDAALPDAIPIDADPGLTATATKIGEPTWELVGWQHFSAPATSNGQIISVASTVWPLHRYDSSTGTDPSSTPHPPPYDDETPDGVTAAGYHSGDLFVRADWSGQRSLLLFVMVAPLPGAPSGKTLDFDDGPMISAALFPMTVDGNLYKGTALVDPDFDSTYPPPAAGVDGVSHFPLTFGENTSFIAGTAGQYHYVVIVKDATGAGWAVTVPFVIH